MNENVITKLNKKKTVLITIITTVIIIAIAVSIWHFCFPKKWFRFDWSFNETNLMLQEYHKAIYFQGYNQEYFGPNYYANASAILDDKYETYTLYNIIFEWNNNKTEYEINKKFNFNNDKSRIYNSAEELTKMRGLNIPEVSRWYVFTYLEGFPVLNFSKIFKGKIKEKEICCKITINFSFDDLEPMTLSYDNNIYVDSYSILGRLIMLFLP